MRRRRRLVLKRDTVRVLETAELGAAAGGVDRPPITVTCPCLTPACPGEYTADCPA